MNSLKKLFKDLVISKIKFGNPKQEIELTI